MWTIEIPNWCPPSVNKGRGRHWSRSDRNTREVVEYLTAFNARAGVPKVRPDYRPVRSVALIVRKSGPLPDPDNLLKHWLDGLKGAGLIVDDSAKWCHWNRPLVSNPTKTDPRCFSLVVIEDVPTAAERAAIDRWFAEWKEKMDRERNAGKKDFTPKLVKRANPKAFSHEF